MKKERFQLPQRNILHTLIVPRRKLLLHCLERVTNSLTSLKCGWDVKQSMTLAAFFSLQIELLSRSSTNAFSYFFLSGTIDYEKETRELDFYSGIWLPAAASMLPLTTDSRRDIPPVSDPTPLALLGLQGQDITLNPHLCKIFSYLYGVNPDLLD